MATQTEHERSQAPDRQNADTAFLFAAPSAAAAGSAQQQNSLLLVPALIQLVEAIRHDGAEAGKDGEAGGAGAGQPALGLAP